VQDDLVAALLRGQLINRYVVNRCAIRGVLSPQIHRSHRLQMAIPQQQVRAKLPVFRTNEHALKRTKGDGWSG
jgi:hypothetical protein